MLEDLSDAHWPPPWRDGDVQAVLDTLDALHAVTPPPGLPRPQEADDLRGGWPDVAADPRAVPLARRSPRGPGSKRASRRCSTRPTRAELDGDSLVHLDIRSDNLCLRDGRCVIVDWNWAARGNPQLDLAFWLPSLRLEGGPEPEAVGGEIEPELAALCAGFFACRAGLPEIPVAPRLRAVQRAQLEIALPWAARALGLSRPRPR